MTNNVKGCQGFTTNFVGFESGYNTYDVYERGQANLNPDPSHSNPFGQVIWDPENAYVTLFQDIRAETAGGHEKNCRWLVQARNRIKLDISN